MCVTRSAQGLTGLPKRVNNSYCEVLCEKRAFMKVSCTGVFINCSAAVMVESHPRTGTTIRFGMMFGYIASLHHEGR